jgi:uncharacterized membrane protein YjfL (UPF0719 family)
MILASILPEQFWPGVLSSFIFGIVGIVLILLAIFLFDKITARRLSLHDELAKGNLSVAVVLASLILGVCYLVHAVIR